MKRQSIIPALALFLSLLFLLSSCMSGSDFISGTPDEATLPTPDGNESPESTPDSIEEDETTKKIVTLPPKETRFYDPSDEVNYPYFKQGEFPSFTAELTTEQLVLPTEELVNVIFSREFYHVFYFRCFDQFITASSYSATISDCHYDEFGNHYQRVSYWSLRDNFNGIQELETRPDAAKILLAKYKQSLTDTAFEDYGYLRPQIPAPADAKSLAMPAFLEIVLSQDVFMNQLTEAEKAELYETIPKIRGTRGPDDRNANHFDMSYLFFDYYTYKEWKELQGE